MAEKRSNGRYLAPGKGGGQVSWYQKKKTKEDTESIIAESGKGMEIHCSGGNIFGDQRITKKKRERPKISFPSRKKGNFIEKREKKKNRS